MYESGNAKAQLYIRTTSTPPPTSQETSPEDVGGMHAAEGILTSRGGMTSHAAVVARGWGKPCVCGCEALQIDEKRGVITVVATHQEFKAGAYISINGTTGEVVKGAQPVQKPSAESGDLATFMKWVDERRRLKVFTNAGEWEGGASVLEGVQC